MCLWTFPELSVFAAIVCPVTLTCMWCQLVTIEDHDDMYHVPVTCVVIEISDKIHKSDFFYSYSVWHSTSQLNSVYSYSTVKLLMLASIIVSVINFLQN